MPSSVLQTVTQRQKQSIPHWLAAALLACLIPIVTHILLPILGNDILARELCPTTLPLMFSLLVGSILYLVYLNYAMRNPMALALYSVVFIRIIFYFAQVMETTGKHFPARIIHIVLLIIPCLLLLFNNFGYLNNKLPYFKYLFAFLIVFLLYFVFFNLNFVDPTVRLTTGTSISQGKLNDYFYTFLGVVFIACAFQKLKTPEEHFIQFHRLNRYLLIFALCHGSLILLGYPLDQFTMVVDGFKRATGLYTHPNELAKAQGLLLTYFMGLYYCCCRAENQTLLKDRMLIGLTIAINLLAFLLSMSKNSFASFGVVSLIFFGFCLFDRKLRKHLLLPAIIFPALVFLALAGYQAHTGNDLLTMLTYRFYDTRSLQWRYSVWNYLLGNMDGNSIWLGHGLTASNMELYRFLFNTSQKIEGQSIFVHNAFISFLYDMGLPGLLVFTGFLSASLQGFKKYARTCQPLYLTTACLSIFSIICSLTDESMTDLNAALLCWSLITMIHSLPWDTRYTGQSNREAA